MENTGEIAGPRTGRVEAAGGVPARVQLLVFCLALGAALLIPLRIISLNFLPPDDALRHAAKAVTGREWSEILVLRPGIAADTHAGWHAVLGAVHRVTGAGPDALVVFEVVSLFFLFCLVPLVLMKRPEAGLLSLLALCVLEPSLITRVMLGRPFIFSMAVLAFVLFRWRGFAAGGRRPAVMMIATALLVALATWIHGLWYLWALPASCFFLARRWREGVRFTLSAGGGVLLGAALTGRPVAFLGEVAGHFFDSFGGYQLTRTLAVEFQPMEVDALVPLAVLLLMLWRRVRLGRWPGALGDPVFVLAVAGWVLGLAIQRFWFDWGLPALFVYVAVQFERGLAEGMAIGSARRLAAAGAVVAALFLLMTADEHSRWTGGSGLEFLSREDPRLAPWLPEPGGIVYANSMQVFYRTFFRNPDAPWRYLVGFEPGMMPREDLAVYRSVLWNFGDDRAFFPWVAKMTPQDRLIISGEVRRPEIPALEWRYAATKTWVGRLPRREQ